MSESGMLPTLPIKRYVQGPAGGSDVVGTALELWSKMLVKLT